MGGPSPPVPMPRAPRVSRQRGGPAWLHPHHEPTLSTLNSVKQHNNWQPVQMSAGTSACFKSDHHTPSHLAVWSPHEGVLSNFFFCCCCCIIVLPVGNLLLSCIWITARWIIKKKFQKNQFWLKIAEICVGDATLAKFNEGFYGVGERVDIDVWVIWRFFPANAICTNA